MAQLTAEIVRTIIKEEISGVDQRVAGLDQKFSGLDQKVTGLSHKIDDLRQEMHQEFANVRQEMMDGQGSILNTMQQFHEEAMDELKGHHGRISDHNHRIAKLERTLGLRESAKPLTA